jgi:hypothetical protein
MVLQHQMTLDGYPKINLSRNNHSKTFRIHQLVIMAFQNITAIPKGMDVDHIDRTKTNNHISNLQIVTKSQNSLNRIRGKSDYFKINQYECSGAYVKTWDSIKQITDELGFDGDNIRACCRETISSVYGFIWRKLNTVDDTTGFEQIPPINGNTYSNYRVDRSGIVINKSNVISTITLHCGYHRVSIKSDDNVYRHLKVHHLVAWTFIENPHNYDEVNHINEEKLDNNVSNLQWCDRTYNTTFSNGVSVHKIDPVTNVIIDTCASLAEAARSVNRKSSSHISNACKYDKIAYGYKWQFAEISSAEILRQRSSLEN